MMKKAYGNDCLSRSKTFEWFVRFKNGRDFLDDDPREGRPSTSVNDENRERIRVLLAANRGATIENIATEVGISV